MNRDDDILQRIERESRAGHERLRQMLREEGRPDLVAEFDARLKDIALGIDGARGCWAALSERQRIVLKLLAAGFKLRRSKRKPRLYDAHGTMKVILSICQIKTLRNLSARELAHVNGGARDPEAEFVVTERGRFVRQHGEVK